MSGDEYERGSLVEFGEDDFKDEVVTAGTYPCVVALCREKTLPEDAKVDPGDRVIEVGYRIQDPASPHNGKFLSDWPYNREKGKNRKLKKWLQWMGYDPTKPHFAFDPADCVKADVLVTTGTKWVGKGVDRRQVNTIEQVVRS